MQALIALLILVLVLGVVLFVCWYVIDLIPMPAGFKQAAKAILALIALLILLARALPLAGVGVL